MLDQDTYLIKEEVAFLKMCDVYNILNPADGKVAAVAREEPAPWAKWMRLLISKRLLPSRVNIYEGAAGQTVLFSIYKPFSIFKARVSVRDASGVELGYFLSKIFSLGGGFWVHHTDGSQFAEVKGDWKGWNFQFLGADGKELGVVSKEWAGVAKELFTSADNYVVSLKPETFGDRKELRVLLLAAALAVDIVYKEGNN